MEEFIPIVFFLGLFGVLILRPITKRIGLLIEATAAEKKARVQRPADPPQLDRIAGLLERLDTRMDLMEQRLDFTERLLDGRGSRRSRLGAAE